MPTIVVRFGLVGVCAASFLWKTNILALWQSASLPTRYRRIYCRQDLLGNRGETTAATESMIAEIKAEAPNEP